MSITHINHSKTFDIAALTVSCGIGILIATQSLTLSLLIIALVVTGILASITPFVMLTLLLVLAPMRTLIATEAAIPLPLDVGQILFVAFCGLWIMHRITHKEPVIQLVWSNIYVPLLAYIGILILSAFNAASLGDWLNEWLKWVFMFILLVLIFHMGQHGKWSWVIFALCVAGLANAIVGIYTFLGGSGALHLLVLGRFFRAFGTFGQPNPFGGFMGLLIPISFMMFLSHSIRFGQYRLKFDDGIPATFYGISTMLMTLALIMSWSRGAWLGFGASMMIVLFALPRRLWQSLLGVGCATILLALLWSSGQLPASITERIASATQELFVLTDVRAVDVTTENYAIVERLAHWQAAINMATDKPLLGIGFGNYEVIYSKYQLMNWDESLGHAHNYYLNVFAETGIIGLIGYITTFITILWFTWQTRSHPDMLSRNVSIGLLGAWSYLLIHSLTDNLYVNNIFIHLGVMLGVLASLHYEIVDKRATRSQYKLWKM